MGSPILQAVFRALAAHAHGGAPDPQDLQSLREHAESPHSPADSPVGPVPVMKPDLDPGRLSGADDAELDAIFRASDTLGIEKLINTGERRVDLLRREIYNNAHWKGYLPKGLLLGEVASRIYTGYFKHFWKEGDHCLGETGYVDGRVSLKHSLEEVTIERRTNDLDPGCYILLRYTDPVFEHLFYDTMKIVNDDLILYRGYTGRFPEGHRGLTAPLLRRYQFQHMDASDHRELFRAGRVPNKEDLEGSWSMDLVANSNHAAGVALLHFKIMPGGKLESKFERKGLIGGLPMPLFAQRHFRSKDFTSFSDELRDAGSGLLLGRFLGDVPGNLLDRFLRSSSLGLFQVEKDDAGNARIGFYYLLSRTK